MVFFREVPYFLVTKSRRLGPRGDFYKLKVKIEGEVSKLSGMIVNLSVVDIALAQVQKTVTEAHNLSQALQLISTFLNNHLSRKVIEIEISRGSNSMVLNSSGFYKKWRCYVLFQDKKAVASKKCQFLYRGKKPDLLSNTWKNTTDFISSVESSKSQISQVWIYDDKINSFEIYSL